MTYSLRNRALLCCFLLGSLIALSCTSAVAQINNSPIGTTPYKTTPLATFNRLSHNIFMNDGDSLATYAKLREIYLTLQGTDRRQAAQLLSMVDAMYGRYDDAATHFSAAFPEAQVVACPSSGTQQKPAIDVLRHITHDARVVLINESHSIIATRAFVHQMLPILRDLGYDYLALEALEPDNEQELAENGLGRPMQDPNLPERGYPLDNGKAGVYLQEPIYAEILREALRLKFTLVAYEDSRAPSRDARETSQAKSLAILLKAHPQAKVLVIAGYSHIWKSDGWMAHRLSSEVEGSLVSIDQISGLGGCTFSKTVGRSALPSSDSPYVLIEADGKAWSSKPERVDVTVLQKFDNQRSKSPSWLMLGGARKGVRVSIRACHNRWPCIVSAYYATESADAVPADRIAIFEKSETPLLFLHPGEYRLEVRSSNNRVNSNLKVSEIH